MRLTGIIGEVAAPTVTFVPGFMQRGDAWEPLAARLAGSYRTVCVDFRSSGFDERVAEVIEAAPPGAAVVGYSMGGRLALHAALREPERFAALALVGTSAGIEGDAERDERRREDAELADWIEARPIEEVVARWERLPVFATQDPALRERQRPGRLRHDPRELARVLRTTGQGVCPPVWDRLGELRCPVLLVAGELDDRYGDAARRMAELIPSASVRLVGGAGHAPQLEAPAGFEAVLREFLDEHLGHRALVEGDA